jgi:heme/copper-type cytochrome/quinol oxidase subunit 4
MSDSSAAVHGSEAHHPGPMKYAMIAVVLSAITLIEFWAFYIDWLHTTGLFAPILVVLSAIKFAMVAMFYMHLKFDHPVFTRFLVLGIFLAGSIMVTLLVLFFISHPPGIA